MGLDMYLDRHIYIGEKSNYNNRELKIEITPDPEKSWPIDPINADKVHSIIERTAYWRKANAIHQWFVDNVQDGNDNCGDYYVSTNQLAELRDTCKRILKHSKIVTTDDIKNGETFYPDGTSEVHHIEGRRIENPSLAEELLPTQQGFFLGSTEYDEWYISDLEETVKQLDEALADERGSFYYHSSW